MLLVSWNVAGRLKRLPEQAERLLALQADVICLQEVTQNTLARWRTLLSGAGYQGFEHGEISGIDVLRAYVTALGGSIDVVATLGDRPWKLA